MAYQALYRQWRPTTFSRMVSQEGIVSTLRNQVMTNRIAHAYLFCGSRGTGKTSTAKIMARAINCEHPVEGDPCCECDSCVRLMHDGSLDVIEIDAASNNGVDEMRDLRDTVKYPPQYGKYKVYIIDEVHMLSTSAFNALLKTLEEPPAHVVFILATTEPQKLPATILSRCQRFDFGRIPADQIAERLREAVDAAEATASDAALRMIARSAEGAMRDAWSVLDMCIGCGTEINEELVRRVLGTSSRSFLFRFSEALREENAAVLLSLIDEMMRGGHDAAVFAREMAEHLRSLLMAKVCGDQLAALLDLTEEDGADYVRQAAGFTETQLMSMMELFMGIEGEMRYASSPRIALESTALKACLRTGEHDTAALLDRITFLETQIKELKDRLDQGVVVTQVQKTEKAPKKQATEQPAEVREINKDAQNVWKQTMEQLRKVEPGIAARLSLGKFVGCEDQVYRWEIADAQSFVAKTLNEEKARNMIAAVLTEISGMKSLFEAGTPTSQRNTPVRNDTGFAGELKDLFGSENVIIQDE